MAWRGMLAWVGVGVLLPAAVSYGAAAVATKEPPEFKKPAPEEALRFLKSLPRVWRSAKGKKVLVQLWEDFTLADLKTLKVAHPGGHIEERSPIPLHRDWSLDRTAPNRFSRRHLRLKPSDWKYFTVFDGLEEFQVGHDLEGITDECLFYMGQLPQSMHTVKLEMSEATGEGVKYLRNLKKLKALSLNFSRTIKDVALVHAREIEPLEYIDVGACPAITGTGVAALAKLKKLKVLKIGSCSLSDAGLVHFKDLAVQELDMSNVEKGWIVEYRGGGRCRFTVSYAGLRKLLTTRDALPNLKRLILTDTRISNQQKQQLAKLRRGLQVR